MTKQKRITQADRLVVYVSHHPGITTPEVCDAFNTDSGSTGQQLAALVQRGVMTRSHNGTHWEYTVVPGSDIPDIELPELGQKADPEVLRAALEDAALIESRGHWLRAATKYSEIMRLAKSSQEIQDISRLRNRCIRNARARRAEAC